MLSSTALERSRGALVALALVLGLSGCDDGQTDLVAGHDGDQSLQGASTPDADIAFAFDFLRNRASMFDSGIDYVSPALTDFLPNTLMVVDGDFERATEYLPGASAIVVGEVIEVGLQRSYTESIDVGTGEVRQAEAPQGDPEGLDELAVVIRIDEGFADRPPGDTVEVSLTVPATIAPRVSNAFLNIGPAVFVLLESGLGDRPEFGHNGLLVGLLGDDGHLTWPMLSDTEARAMLEGATSLAELRVRASEPPRFVEFQTNELGTPQRVRPPASDSPAPAGPVVVGSEGSG